MPQKGKEAEPNPSKAKMLILILNNEGKTVDFFPSVRVPQKKPLNNYFTNDTESAANTIWNRLDSFQGLQITHQQKVNHVGIKLFT